MKIDKEKMVYAGIGAFFLLVIFNSTRKVKLEEVSLSQNTASFDSSKLPPALRPPYRLADGEGLPKTLAKRSFNLLGLKPRFDI
jgi:hypothetical protein